MQWRFTNNIHVLNMVTKFRVGELVKSLSEQEGLELFPKNGEGTTQLKACRKVDPFPWS